MKFRILLPAIIGIAAFSSCATAYRTGQTPDDVYYSPAREAGAAYVSTDQQRDGRGSYSRANDYYSYDDRWLRMRVSNRYRWSAFDDYDWNDWRYNSWSYSYYNPYGWNNYWNSYYRWNSWYNPYCSGYIIVNPKTNPTVYTKVRNFSLNSYTNTNYNNSNAVRSAKGMRLSPGGYNNTNRSTLGSSIRKVFSGSGRDSYYNPSSSADRPTRTYTPSSSSSSSSPSRSSGGSGGSSGGGVSRPSRGGN